jgi:hypothetical protein
MIFRADWPIGGPYRRFDLLVILIKSGLSFSPHHFTAGSSANRRNNMLSSIETLDVATVSRVPRSLIHFYGRADCERAALGFASGVRDAHGSIAGPGSGACRRAYCACNERAVRRLPAHVFFQDTYETHQIDEPCARGVLMNNPSLRDSGRRPFALRCYWENRP